MPLVINDIGLLSAILNNFRNLLEMLEGPVDLSFSSSFTADDTSFLLVGYKERIGIWVRSIFRIFMFWFYIYIYFSICLAMAVKCLLNSRVIS